MNVRLQSGVEFLTIISGVISFVNIDVKVGVDSSVLHSIVIFCSVTDAFNPTIRDIPTLASSDSNTRQERKNRNATVVCKSHTVQGGHVFFTKLVSIFSRQVITKAGSGISHPFWRSDFVERSNLAVFDFVAVRDTVVGDAGVFRKIRVSFGSEVFNVVRMIAFDFCPVVYAISIRNNTGSLIVCEGSVLKGVVSKTNLTAVEILDVLKDRTVLA